MFEIELEHLNSRNNVQKMYTVDFGDVDNLSCGQLIQQKLGYEESHIRDDKFMQTDKPH